MQTGFVLETIAGLNGLHTIADTSGHGTPENFKALAEAVDIVFFGLKLADSEVHKRFTGIDNRLIRANLEQLKKMHTPFVVRVPLIPGITDTDENLTGLAGWLHDSPNLERVDLLPYNSAAGAKYTAAGMEFLPGFDEKRPINYNTEPFTDAGIKVCIN